LHISVYIKKKKLDYVGAKPMTLAMRHAESMRACCGDACIGVRKKSNGDEQQTGKMSFG